MCGALLVRMLPQVLPVGEFFASSGKMYFEFSAASNFGYRGGSNHREHREHRNYVKAFDTEIGEDAPRGTENYANCLTFLNNGTAVASFK